VGRLGPARCIAISGNMGSGKSTLPLRSDRIDYVSDLVDQVDVIRTIESCVLGGPQP